MDSMLPIITVSDLQRSAKTALASVKDYAVVQSHGRDRAFILHPDLGRILLQSGMLDALRKQWNVIRESSQKDKAGVGPELEQLIGNVLRELSKR
ncbi:MAG: hypothetical protein HOO67_05335 [Candidatus Peribacteraceae bacterium]|nr:hypothetical protein [Candidatus Peribacteraceae bacterium]